MTKSEIEAALYNARCLCGISRESHQGLQAYFLAISTGLSTNIGTLLELTACQKCAPKSQQDDILAWIIQSQSGVTGTPEQIINSSPCIYCIPHGYLDIFKTYMLWTTAKAVDPGVINPVPTSLPPSWVSTPAAYVEAVGTYIAKNQPPPRYSFDPALCVVIIANGGGDTFDCYTVGTVQFSLQVAGSGFGSNKWAVSDNDFGYPYGDTFDLYAVGAVVTNTLNRGEGFPSPWYLS